MAVGKVWIAFFEGLSAITNPTHIVFFLYEKGMKLTHLHTVSVLFKVMYTPVLD